MIPAGISLRGMALGVALFASIPVVATLLSAGFADHTLWQHLSQTRLPVLLPNTLKLVAAVAVMTALLGVSTAWAVTRLEFPGRRVWEWLLVLPFAIPGYVLAYTWASLMAPGGAAQHVWGSLFANHVAMPSLYSFWGVVTIMSLVNYPYVYLMARSAFLNQNTMFDDAARSLGASSWRRFWSVHVALAWPAIVTGVALACMEVMADFGTVALLRYPTFTEAIYRQMTAHFDPAGAVALASLLMSITFFFFVIERAGRGRRRFDHTHATGRTLVPSSLSGVQQTLLHGALGLLVTAAFVLPMAMLILWSTHTLWQGAVTANMARYAFNSVWVSASAATLAIALALPAAYLHARSSTLLNRAVFFATSLGYSLPGPVIAVSLLIVTGYLFPALYGGLALLLAAYVIRFIGIPLQSQEAALSTVSPALDDAAQTLGAGTWERFRRILLPLIRPALWTGWIVVFIDCMKELPATLMLRPVAFDTLAVRVWVESSEALWEMAAFPALLIVAFGLIPVHLIIHRMRGAARV